MNIGSHRMRGVSLVEVIIVFALVSIIFTYALPDVHDQLVRSSVEDSLKLAGPAQDALLKTCNANGAAIVKTNLDAGYFYIPSGTEQDHVNNILLGANCSKGSMFIVIWTTSTGAETDPILELSADGSGADRSWTCHTIRGELRHVPSACRNSYKAI